MTLENKLIRRCAGLMEAEMDGELVGLHVEQGACYGFNTTATRIWTMLEQPTSLTELRDALLLEFDVDVQTCDAELEELILEMQRNGLVEVETARS